MATESAELQHGCTGSERLTLIDKIHHYVFDPVFLILEAISGLV